MNKKEEKGGDVRSSSICRQGGGVRVQLYKERYPYTWKIYWYI